MENALLTIISFPETIHKKNKYDYLWVLLRCKEIFFRNLIGHKST